MKSLITWLLVVCLLPVLTGCQGLSDQSLTVHLWDNLAANHNGPTPYPNLKISQDSKDFLVQYDEIRDKNAHVTRRAYWLYASEHRVEKGKRPQFVNPHLADRLQAVTVETSSVPDAIVDSSTPTGAVLLSDHRHFTMMANGNSLGTFCLPTYADGKSRAELAALTPLTVTVDTAVVAAEVGTVVGVIYLADFVSSNGNVQWH